MDIASQLAEGGLTVAKKSIKIIEAARDEVSTLAPVVIAADTDADRAWTMEQALASYRRLRVRLLEYLESRKEIK